MASIDTLHLDKFNEQDWREAVKGLVPQIHEVDRSATQIWFLFYPLTLVRHLQTADDAETVKHKLSMMGSFGLEDKIDSSHYFFYGHRYWKHVRTAIEEAVSARTEIKSLTAAIESVAARAAELARADRSLLLGISAAGLMTLAQVGHDRFASASGSTHAPSGLMARSPEQIVAERKKDDSQGLFGFLKTVDKKFSVIYNEYSKAGRFPVIYDQEIASASAGDRSQDWHAKDPRCWEGPVPVECTSASCGTCWVGVIAGADKLAPAKPREERQLKVFGYVRDESDEPYIRLACQARAEGNVTIVIPPWNGRFGKEIYRAVGEVELEPVTTSAKRLREVVKAATRAED